ncbi:syndecan-3 isoform X1 [Polypterus senegalus]|uniref:syndecan-3 isoform X1 n=1 Tax=Polypterus senegalus TaxID=55291 RepID=UPI0019642BF0|nr:syndecan-3 isoform X1 [Polypterus senegalus]
MKLPCLIAVGSLMLILGEAAMTYRWPRGSDNGNPEDQEGSADVSDDEDYGFSGSGSGYPVQDIEIRSKAQFSTEPPPSVSTTQAMSSAPSVAPAAVPTQPAISTDDWEDEKEEASTVRLTPPPITEPVHRKPTPARAIPMATTTSLTTTVHHALPTVVMATEMITTEDVTEEDTTTEQTTVLPTTESTTATTTTASVPRRRTTTTAITLPTTAITATARPRAVFTSRTTPESSATTQSKNIYIEHTTSQPMPLAPEQTETLETIVDTTVSTEMGGVGPSGDFEIREEEELKNNEILIPATKPTVRKIEPDLNGNTIDSGSSAAQLPQKNILERKEVLIAIVVGGMLGIIFADFLLIAVIVGGVVGALFAAFLVMLLIYRMKKKDEGSYTLEEPKQATVTYQKPDKQEEFYA